ncbi:MULTISPECIES: hypothetical protein [Bacillus cereus group]|nr:hypothetical protein [Bacillus cereus]MDA1521400.1 hypothetical protein [Bacillus cereus]BCC09390.1 hypothetical protein BCM0060_p2056 [Bacillus cereus]BCC16610.1 hypothetical protein BCM0075_1380 [Bacillus cereus]BCC50509.1 hypothetical protein BCJMU02_p2103 [Bacillus cereus]BCD08807.1 hypothetical protein BC30052_p2089 [Bacillus cereus]
MNQSVKDIRIKAAGLAGKLAGKAFGKVIDWELERLEKEEKKEKKIKKR